MLGVGNCVDLPGVELIWGRSVINMATPSSTDYSLLVEALPPHTETCRRSSRSKYCLIHPLSRTASTSQGQTIKNAIIMSTNKRTYWHSINNHKQTNELSMKTTFEVNVIYQKLKVEQ